MAKTLSMPAYITQRQPLVPIERILEELGITTLLPWHLHNTSNTVELDDKGCVCKVTIDGKTTTVKASEPAPDEPKPVLTVEEFGSSFRPKKGK